MGPHDSCIVRVRGLLLAEVAAFDTQPPNGFFGRGGDILRIGGERFSGNTGPPNGTITSWMVWSSNGGTQRTGWKICGLNLDEDTTTQGSTTTFTARPAPTTTTEGMIETTVEAPATTLLSQLVMV